MTPGYRSHRVSGQSGQAATEFLVASVFILVPLFLIIPLLGKYIDIRHAAIQQARFEVWEYTVWTGDLKSNSLLNENKRPMHGINEDESAGFKDYDSPKNRPKLLDTRHQGMKYFFSDPTDSQYGIAGGLSKPNPLWKDHKGIWLVKDSPIETKETKCDPNQGDNQYTLNNCNSPDGLWGIMDTTIALTSDIIQYLDYAMLSGDAHFDAIYTAGYMKTGVNVPIRSIEEVFPRQTLSGTVKDKGPSLNIYAKASVLTDGWNAGSRDNATSESRGLVITSFLRPVSEALNLVISPINNFFGWFKKIPLVHLDLPQLPGVPDFGYVDDDLIPLDHLDLKKENVKAELVEIGDIKELKFESGLYDYDIQSK